MITFRLLRFSHGDSLIAMGLLGLSGLHVIFLLLGKAVHGSVRVGFVPNPEPTRPDRLARNSTRRRPAWLIGSGGSDLQRTAVGSVGVGDLKIAQNQGI